MPSSHHPAGLDDRHRNVFRPRHDPVCRGQEEGEHARKPEEELHSEERRRNKPACAGPPTQSHPQVRNQGADER